MKKFLLLILVSMFSSLSFSQTPTAGNTLPATGITSIASTTAPPFKMSINGTLKLYGTGNGVGANAAAVVNSPTLYLANTTTGARQYTLNADNSGAFRISDVVGTTSFTGTDRFFISGLSGTLGNIGIGNSAPTTKLDVTGTVKAAGLILFKLTIGQKSEILKLIKE